MPDVVVETKLLLPRPRASTLPRPRLLELLARGWDAPLLLVSAPAGFGKTTLLGTWMAAGERGRATAWVSLDERDRLASSFWTHALRAIQRCTEGAASALEQLQADREPIEAVLTTLLNELSVQAADLHLVLDDYHLADGPEVQRGMTFLLDHLPPQLRVVISSRADPGLPLPRLRVRGELVEIRAADLRFTGEEAAAYLNDLHRLALQPHQLAALSGRTEGWPAALQLAALSLQGRDSSSRSHFIDGFAGDDRFVVDYLADEVLDRLVPDVRRFLLETSVLDRLTGPLCDAVTRSTGGRAMLDLLNRENLFVVPLDARRGWYRYHHLFADVLRTRLIDERPDNLPELHRRASRWYDQASEPEAAVRHALLAGDVDGAAAQVERAIPALLRQRREAVIRRWVEDLPADIVRNRPVLAVGFIAGLAQSNAFDGLERRLRDAEHLLAAPVDHQVVVDQAQVPRLPAALATYRAALALVAGDLPGTLEHARSAWARANHDHVTIASASALVGLASWQAGELETAHQAYQVAAENLSAAGHVADVLGCSIALVDIEMTQGTLGEAQRTCEHALYVAGREGSQPRGAADMHVQLSRVAWERGDLAAVADHLRQADEIGEAGGLPQHPYRWRVAMALLRQAEGDATTAVGLLDEAEKVYVGDYLPNVRPVAAVRARVLAASGQVAEALTWARRQGVSPGDDLTYLREYEHITLVRVLLADHAATGDQASLGGAGALVDRLLPAAQAAERTGVVIEELVLQALARAAAGNVTSAVEPLEAALRLAEPEGWVRLFTDEAAAMSTLLPRVARRHRRWAFVHRLLEAVAAPRQPGDAPAPMPTAHSVGLAGPAVPATRDDGRLIDPLSDRELEVLRYLGSDLDGPAIARRLGVSLSTVRTHTQHVYTKLGVNNRRAAILRGHQLNIFSTSARR